MSIKSLPLSALAISVAAIAAFLMAAIHPLESEAATPAATSAVRYQIAQYGSIDDPGGTVVVRRINSLKEIVGGFKRANQPKSSKAFILTADGFEDLAGDISVDFSVTYGLNDQSEVVGALNTITAVRPFRTQRGQTLKVLPLLSGDQGGIAFDINNAGESAGYSSGKSGVRAVWWGIGGDIHALQGLPGNFNYAQALNDNGDLVGVAGDAAKRGVLWPNKGAPVDLGTLLGFFGSEAVSINNKGEIVGFASGTSRDLTLSRAVLWSPLAQSIQDLGALPGGAESRARDINDSSEVVGTSTSSAGNRAFVWNAREGMLDINALVAAPGLVLTDAVGINKNGDIVAIGHSLNPTQPADDSEEHELPRQIFVLTKVK